MEEMVALLKEYIESWLRQEKLQFLSILAEDILIVECHGASYIGIQETEKWFDTWNHQNKVVHWEINSTWYDQEKNTLLATWEFRAEDNGGEEVSCFDGVSIMTTHKNKITQLYEYSMKHEKYRPFKEQ